MTGFLYVDYIDGDQSSYRGLEVSTGSSMLKRFDYGDITIDYIDYVIWVNEHEEINSVVHSSSVDHFYFDGDKYKALIIDHANNNIVITDTSNMTFEKLNRLVTYPVHQNIETFEELKIFYRSIRPKTD